MMGPESYLEAHHEVGHRGALGLGRRRAHEQHLLEEGEDRGIERRRARARAARDGRLDDPRASSSVTASFSRTYVRIGRERRQRLAQRAREHDEGEVPRAASCSAAIRASSRPSMLTSEASDSSVLSLHSWTIAPYGRASPVESPWIDVSASSAAGSTPEPQERRADLVARRAVDGPDLRQPLRRRAEDLLHHDGDRSDGVVGVELRVGDLDVKAAPEACRRYPSGS